MRKSYVELRPDGENELSDDSDAGFTCDTCGESYRKPLLATVHSSEGSEQYYVCPRCMVKVGEIEAPKTEEKEEKKLPVHDSKKLGTASKGSADCGHFLGYLAKRSKDTPIPEECLTCSKMIECTIR